jgi:hypothetical protein
MRVRYMTIKISKGEARAFLRRWRIVNAEEQKQLRRTSMSQKLQQLNQLLAWSKYFGRKIPRANEAATVRRRWLELRRSYHG